MDIGGGGGGGGGGWVKVKSHKSRKGPTRPELSPVSVA